MLLCRCAREVRCPSSYPANRLSNSILGRKFSSEEPVWGQATVEGTKLFVAKSKLPLYHRFIRSQLLINPIIHGPPIPDYVRFQKEKGKKSGKDELVIFDEYVYKAVLEHHCNAIFVYDHTSKWAFKHVGKLIGKTTLPPPVKKERTPHPTVSPRPNEGPSKPLTGGIAVRREGLVLCANLGTPMNPQDLKERIQAAKAACNVTNIDLFLIEYSAQTLMMYGDQMSEIVEELDKYCEQEEAIAFGLSLSIAPFNFHTPAYRQTGPHMMMPAQIEQMLTTESKYGDLVVYPLAPSTHYPATYLMLEADPDINKNLPQFVPQEKNEDEIPIVTERFRVLSRAALHPLICKPGSGSDDEKENMQIAIEEGSVMNKVSYSLELEEKGETTKGEKSDTYATSKGAEELLPTTEERNVAEGLMEKLLMEEAKSTKYGLKTEKTLISGLNNSQLEMQLADNLDKYCNALMSTPRLQDKALRVVFSVGIDCAIVDAECSAKMGRLELRQGDIIPNRATTGVFGNFKI